MNPEFTPKQEAFITWSILILLVICVAALVLGLVVTIARALW